MFCCFVFLMILTYFYLSNFFNAVNFSKGSEILLPPPSNVQSQEVVIIFITTRGRHENTRSSQSVGTFIVKSGSAP